MREETEKPLREKTQDRKIKKRSTLTTALLTFTSICVFLRPFVGDRNKAIRKRKET